MAPDAVQVMVRVVAVGVDTWRLFTGSGEAIVMKDIISHIDTTGSSTIAQLVQNQSNAHAQQQLWLSSVSSQ